ncbi:MAG: hypothetical protein LR008_00205 [Candidatus Pacebacteria bacterium]|nr:hypothetical protein [Candidatus Paceibacterota bacterium]
MEPVTILGVVGATIILIAFSLNQIGRWSSNSLLYDWSNVVGSFILIAYAVLIDSIPFIILNSVWFIVSFRDVIKAR